MSQSARRGRLLDLGVLFAVWMLVAQLDLAPWGRHVALDDLAYSSPNLRITLDAWLHGRAPLWNPYNFGGTPHLGNAQTAAMYPGLLLAAPFPDLLGPDVVLAAHLLLIGIGWWWLGHRLDLARPAPVVMGVLALTTGATVLRSGLLVHLLPLAWAPIAMVGVHAIVHGRRTGRAVALTAASMWCIVVSGHPQSALMVGVLLGAWTIGVLVDCREPRRLLHVAAAASLAAAMAAPMLLAARASIAAAAAARSDESLRTPSWIARPTLLARDFLGQPLESVRTAVPNHEAGAYVGAVAAALAVLGLVAACRRRSAAVVATVVAGLFALSLSFGLRSPVFRAARRWLPGFDLPRVSVRWFWVVAMVIVLLAGVGVDSIRRDREPREAWWLLAACAVLGVSPIIGMRFGAAATIIVWVIGAAAVGVARWAPSTRVSLATAVVAAGVIALELLLPVWKRIDEPNSGPVSSDGFIGAAPRSLTGQPGFALAIVDERYDARYVVGGMRPNANVLADVRSIDGYDGGVAVSVRWTAALHQFLPAVNDLTFRAQLFGQMPPSRMARLGVRFVLYDPGRGPADQVVAGWRQRDVTDDFQVWENPQWAGDVTVWYDTRRVEGPIAAGDMIREQFDDLGATALVEFVADDVRCDADCRPDHAISRSSRPGHRVVEVEARRRALVALPEQFDEGWVATVDGVPVAVVPVDGVWAGVVVDAGPHTIRLTYAPSWWRPSVVVSLLAMLVVVLLAAGPAFSGWRHRRGTPQ